MINLSKREFEDFSKKILVFIGFVKNFELACSNKDESFKKILELRNNVLELRNDILLFLQFKDGILADLNNKKAWQGRNVGKERDVSQKVFAFKIKKPSKSTISKNVHYQKMMFHLKEICQELLETKNSLDIVVSKKIGQKELFERLVEFDSLKWHLIDNHFDDLINYEDKKFFLSRGLLTSISDFLEEYSKIS